MQIEKREILHFFTLFQTFPEYLADKYFFNEWKSILKDFLSAVSKLKLFLQTFTGIPKECRSISIDLN